MVVRRPSLFPSPSLALRSGLTLMTVIVALGPMATWGQVTPNAVEEKQALAHVRTLLDRGWNDEALRLIEQFLDRASPPSLMDRFAFFHAVALQVQGQEQTAIILLEQFLEDYPSSALTHKARLRLGALYTNSSRPTRAIPILSQAVDQAENPAIRTQAQDRLRLAYERTGDDLRAIHVALTQMREPAEDGRRDLSEYVQRLILQRMSERSLNDLLDQFPNAYPGDLALIRLIELHAARGDTGVGGTGYPGLSATISDASVCPDRGRVAARLRCQDQGPSSHRCRGLAPFRKLEAVRDRSVTRYPVGPGTRNRFVGFRRRGPRRQGQRASTGSISP